MTLHAADRDPTVDPGTDFYRYANGGWLDTHPIPAGYGAWGALEEVQVRNEQILHRLLGQARDEPASELDRLLGDAFAAGMDTEAIEAGGITAIEPFLAAIDAAEDLPGLLGVLPDLHRHGIGVLYGWGVTVDHDDSTRHLLWLVPAGLGLPDRESYLDDRAAAVDLRAAYVRHVAAQLAHLGLPAEEAAARAGAVLAFETRLAEQHLRAEERRDPGRTLNRRHHEDLDALAPGLGLSAALAAIGAGPDVAATVNVQQPDYLAALPGILVDTDLATLRSYAAFHVVRDVADALPRAIEDEAFDFYGRRIEGKKEPKQRYQRVIAALGSDLGEALGRLYVEEAFPPEAKERALAMVDAIVAEMRHSMETRTWMSPSTRAAGLAKLDAMQVKIGYPDRWRDWSGLRQDRTSYAANRLAAARFELDRQLAQLPEPVDPAEWEMPPHVVNAYYHPVRNEIVFPAGILQPPMFDPAADDAVNFGGIGTVIAHEITHGFDDQGRRFDAQGAFRDWWDPADEEHFTALADRLVAQYDAYVAVGDVHVNGRLTLGENIADLGGVTLAQRAHARAHADATDVDGLTPAQRFFLATATLWRANTSEELARTLAQIDPHSPRRLRVLGPFAHLDAFQDAFGLPDDAPMLRPREDRVEIW